MIKNQEKPYPLSEKAVVFVHKTKDGPVVKDRHT